MRRYDTELSTWLRRYADRVALHTGAGARWPAMVPFIPRFASIDEPPITALTDRLYGALRGDLSR